MKLSIVTTLYKSSPYIREFYERICQSASKIVANDFEIIFVNDGSPDDSLDIALEINAKDPRVKVINFSKNFGHHKAMMTGMRYATGEKVFLIDVDLEEEPELLETFWEELSQDSNLDFVFGVQKIRKGGLFEKLSGYLWYKFVNLLTQNSIPENFLTVRLMTRNYVQNLTAFKERELNFSTLISLTGFNSKQLMVKKGYRGRSSYNFLHKINITVNTITSSTTFPLWIVFYIGLFITVAASIVAVKLIFERIFLDIGIDGWTSLMIAILFFGGLTIFVLGMIGIYLSKIFIEVKNRPYTVIKSIHGNLDSRNF